MATTFRSFAADTVGALPADIAYYHKSGNWTLTVENESSEKVLRFLPNGSGADASFAQFLTPGSVDNTNDVEIVAHFRLITGESASNDVPTATLFQVRDVASPNAQGYFVQWHGSTGTWRIQRASSSGGTSSNLLTISPTPFALTAGATHRVRLRCTTGGVLRARVIETATDAAELSAINALLTAASLPTVASIDAAKNTAAAWQGSYSDGGWRTSGYFSVGHYSHLSEACFPLVGMATAGETAPTTGYATPTITDAGDEDYMPGETGINIVGTNFGATQGSGKVYISPTDNVSNASRVEQTVTGWSDTSVVFTCVPGALARATNLYLFVVNGGGLANAAGRVVQIPVTGPTITSINDLTLTDGQVGVVISGSGFGATRGFGTLVISPSSSDFGAAGAKSQVAGITSWSDTSITFTASRGTLAFLTAAYVFVVNDDFESNAAGFALEFVPRVYVQADVKDLTGTAVALNGEALLVWRTRPSAAKQSPDQVLTLGSIPSGVLNAEIDRGALAVGDPVWCMLVGPSGNKASAKRIVPVYS